MMNNEGRFSLKRWKITKTNRENNQKHFGVTNKITKNLY